MKRLDIIAGLGLGGAAVWLFLSHESGFAANPTPYVIGALMIFGYVFAAWLSRHDTFEPPKPPEKELPPLSNNYGSAEFADQRHSIPEGVRGFSGVFFGMSSSPGNFRDTGAPVCSAPESHTLIVAKTGSGKGTRVIIPTLLRCNSGSMIVMDPKGENAAVTARARVAAGSTVHIINPWGVLNNRGTWSRLGFQAATFNPLDILVREDPNLVANALALGATISPSLPGEKDAFWPEMSAQIIAAVVLWLTDREGLPQDPLNPASPPETKTLRRLAEIVRKPDFRKFLEIMYGSEGCEGAIRNICGQFVGMPDVTYGGIMGNVAQATSFLIDPRVLDATDQSSFSIEELVSRRTTIYLIPPDKITVQARWLRLVIAAAIQTLRTKRYDDTRCMFLIDEFPALGKMADVANDIALMRGFGVDFVLVVQGINQLHDIYGSADGTILNNCAYKWFCNVNDLQSAKYVSESLGKKTVRTITKGESKGESKGFKGAGSENEGESTTYGEKDRELLQPSEVQGLGRDTAILSAPNSKPQYLIPVDYWRLIDAFESFRDSAPHLLWEPPLQYDPNPLVAASKGRSPVRGSVPSAKPIAPTPAPEPPARSRIGKLLDWLNHPLTGGGTDRKGYGPKEVEQPPANPVNLYPLGPIAAPPKSNYNSNTYSPKAEYPQAKEAPRSKPIDLNAYSPRTEDPQPPQPKQPAAKPSVRKPDLDYYSPDRVAEREAAEAARNKPSNEPREGRDG